MEKKLLLVDANSLLHRAYHAYPPLTTPKGEMVGAVYGFANMLLTAIEKINPTHVAVAWDVGKETFRHAEYKEYKAGRAETDQELIDQIGRTEEVVKVLNIPQFGIKNYEADDLIGTLAEQAKKKADQVMIMTGDRDAFQLVEDQKVVVYMPGGGSRFAADKGVSIYDETAVKMKYGLTPAQIIDLKAMMGDASDNIKGVPGVGQVTATKILQQAGSLPEVYEKLEKLDLTERVKKLLREGKESAFLSRKLATIERKAPIKFDWEKCKLANYDRDKAMALFEELRFKSLFNKLPKDTWEENLEEVFK